MVIHLISGLVALKWQGKQGTQQVNNVPCKPSTNSVSIVPSCT